MRTSGMQRDEVLKHHRYWRSLNGVPVRSLKRRPHARQLNLRYPSVVRRFRVVVAVERQCGQCIGVSSSHRGRGYATDTSPEI